MLDKKYIEFLKKNLSDADYKEMAIPSYTHKNKLIRWLFNKRLETILSFNFSHKRVLDYGTGTGILIPELYKQCCDKVYAADTNIVPVTKRVERNKWINVHGKPFVEIVKVNRKANAFNAFKLKDDLDVVVAADVLEHVDDLKGLIARFAELLYEHRGYLIVSGPTENWMYKLARMFAGFKNDYHVRNVNDIKKAILDTGCFKLEQTVTLPNIFIPGFKVMLFKSKGMVPIGAMSQCRW
jgi:2-polyprenyl-3-methyl-5-hydroxy-6-metoxy-1,4-benzoquinol methylase